MLVAGCVAGGWLGFPLPPAELVGETNLPVGAAVGSGCDRSWLLDELLVMSNTRQRVAIGRISGVMGEGSSVFPSLQDTIRATIITPDGRQSGG